MPKRQTEFTVTHSYAPDPDLQRVEAALALWQGALADRLIAQDRGSTEARSLPQGENSLSGQ